MVAAANQHLVCHAEKSAGPKASRGTGALFSQKARGEILLEPRANPHSTPQCMALDIMSRLRAALGESRAPQRPPTLCVKITAIIHLLIRRIIPIANSNTHRKNSLNHYFKELPSYLQKKFEKL